MIRQDGVLGIEPGRILQFGKIECVAGTTSLVTAVAGKRICLVNYVVIMDTAGTFKFADDAGDLTGAMPTVAASGASAPGFSPWFVTGINKALSIICTAGAHGHFTYFLDPK